jgi:hypothetical protein
MTTAIAPSNTARAVPRAPERTESAPAPDAWPFNLWLLLGVLGVFALNVAAVFYLAGQMPN